MFLHGILLCVTLVTVLEASSIDEIIMKAAPRSSTLDTFHMSPEGEVMMMVELDILMNIKQYMELRGSSQVQRQKRKAVRSRDTRWTNCYVYYEINASDFDDEDVGVIEEAIEQWRKYTCLQFLKATPNTVDKIVFTRGDGGCYSRLGRIGGTQNIGLSKGCIHRGVIIHEIGHAIGWIHEQARPDRDRYIRVNFNKIPSNWHPQFEKFDERLINNLNVEYDYSSIMHYSGNAVAPMAIETLDPDYQSVIGQRDGLSFRDVMIANLMYGCPEMKCPRSNMDCSQFGHDAFMFKPDGDNQCQCYCPSTSADEVLMPCSKSKSTTTVTRVASTTTTVRPVKTTTTSQPEPMECRDLRENCPQLAARGECKMDMERMFLFCKRSCNFCGKEDMCMDYDPSCPLLALANFCDRPDFESIMKQKCQKSCKFCTPVDPCTMQHQMGLADGSSSTGQLHPCSGLGILILLWVVHLFKLF